MKSRENLIRFVKSLTERADDMLEFNDLLAEYKNDLRGRCREKSDTGLKVDTIRLHSDILARLNRLGKPQKYLVEKLKISRSVFFRLSVGHEMSLDTFLKLVNWIDRDINDYIIKDH